MSIRGRVVENEKQNMISCRQLEQFRVQRTVALEIQPTRQACANVGFGNSMPATGTSRS